MHIWLIPDFYLSFHIYEESRFSPTGWTPLHLVPQFNSIAFWRSELHFVWKNFSLKKYLSAARVALKLRSSWIAQRQETKGNVSTKWTPVHGIRLLYSYIMQRYFLGTSLQENFTQLRASTRPVVYNSTTGVRTTHHTTCHYLTHPNVVAAG